MGNSLGAKKTAKVMRISGEEFKVKAGVEAGQIVKDYPGHVLLESEAVKHYGVRAKPLDPNHELKARRLYFLVELPKVTITETRNNVKVPRRVQSGINMSAKDRLENLMLSRRSVSDLTMMKPMSITPADSPENGTPMRVTMRLRKSEVEKLMQESKDRAEAAEKIVGLCMVKNSTGSNNNNNNDNNNCYNNNVNGENGGRKRRGGIRDGANKPNQKRVSFCPISEGEIQIAVA
ncbi:uncharacterized protein At1g66480 [Humulus lupulus]|uniref:uncharacterized protein At1g66480 n=1 Tax=Humulus lupulus TaxID=3486 RepID=UPI002B404ADE|nr:uncharacterized protein At1g66480 [Humulus lupulus]